jgi:hypothetical protein
LQVLCGENNVPHGIDVGERVAVDGNNVRIKTRLELSDGFGPVEKFCAVDQVGAQDICRRHAVLHHELELAGLGAVRERADIGAEREGNAGGELLFELGGVVVEQGLVVGGVAGVLRVFGEVLHDGESGHGVDLLVAHQLHGLGRELVGVVDGGDAGVRGVGGAGLSCAMDGDAGAGAVGFRDSGGKLDLGVLIGSAEDVAGQGVGAGFVDLGEVRALFVLLPHHGHEFGGIIGVVGVGEHVLSGVEADGVLMSPEDVDGVAGDAHAWAGDLAAVDGVADGDVGTACALGAHIALCGEAGHEVGFGGGGGGYHALGHGLLHGLQVFSAGVEEEMDVGVDQAGHKGGVAKVEDDGAAGVFDLRADLADTVADDQDFAGRDHLAGGYVENAGGVEDGGVEVESLEVLSVGGGEGDSGDGRGEQEFHDESSILYGHPLPLFSCKVRSNKDLSLDFHWQQHTSLISNYRHRLCTSQGTERGR